MALTKRQSEWYKWIRETNANAAERYVLWGGNMRKWNDEQLAAQGRRGKVAGTLDKILHFLDAEDGSYLGRHVFLFGLTDAYSSTSQLTYNQAEYLLKGSLDDNDQIIEANAEDMRAVTIGLIKAGVPDLIAEGAQKGPNPRARVRQMDPSTGTMPDDTPPEPEAPPEPSTVDETPKPEREPVKATEDQYAAVREIAWHREAILSATARVERDGYQWLFTMRAGIDNDMLQGFLAMVDQATDRLAQEGFTPVIDYRSMPASGASSTSDDGPSENYGYTTPGGEKILASGSALLEGMQTDVNGKTEYQLKGFQWPLNDSRDADIKLSTIPDPELEMGEADFEAGSAALTAEKMKKRWGKQLTADWIHKEREDGKRFRDVVRLHL